MNDKNLEFMLAVGTLVLKYGLPAAIELMRTWRIEGEPTEADIADLRAMVPLPDTYFGQ